MCKLWFVEIANGTSIQEFMHTLILLWLIAWFITFDIRFKCYVGHLTDVYDIMISECNWLQFMSLRAYSNIHFFFSISSSKKFKNIKNIRKPASKQYVSVFSRFFDHFQRFLCPSLQINTRKRITNRVVYYIYLYIALIKTVIAARSANLNHQHSKKFSEKPPNFI